MTIDERRTAATERVKVLGQVARGLTGEAEQEALHALAYAIREVCLLDIESYGRLTATVANPETQH